MITGGEEDLIETVRRLTLEVERLNQQLKDLVQLLKRGEKQ